MSDESEGSSGKLRFGPSEKSTVDSPSHHSSKLRISPLASNSEETKGGKLRVSSNFAMPTEENSIEVNELDTRGLIGQEFIQRDGHTSFIATGVTKPGSVILIHLKSESSKVSLDYSNFYTNINTPGSAWSRVDSSLEGSAEL